MKKHWLDLADDKYSKELIADVRILCKILLVFLPLPIFWALYDQQGSRWTSQAQQLNGQLGSVLIKPDQFQAINPLFIIVLVPLFDTVIYPIMARCNLLKRPLQRMTVGLILAVIAFVIAAVLESQMQVKFAANNPKDQLTIVNLSPCEISANQILVNPNGQFIMRKPVWDDLGNLSVASNCSYKSNYSISNQQLPLTIVFYVDPGSMSIKALELVTSYEDLPIGASQLRLVALNMPVNASAWVKTILVDESTLTKVNALESHQLNNTSYFTIDYSNNYKFELVNSSVSGNQVLFSMNQIKLETCGKYTLLVYQSFNGTYQAKLITEIRPGGLSIFWQLLQIFVMTVGEIMFSISGLTFAYSQAPASMKSVLQAAWCLTVACGNLVVVIVAEARFVDNQVWEYVLFAGLLTLATGVFAYLAYRYEYVEDAVIVEDDSSNDKKDEIDSDLTSKPKTAFNIFKRVSTEKQNVKLVRMSSLEDQQKQS